MPDTSPRTELKSAYHLLWSHYMRTGHRLSGDAAGRFLEGKACRPDEPDSEQKSAEGLLFEHYLRTGERLSGEVARHFLERKFNPYHDPDDGRFTFKPGGGSLPPRRANPGSGGGSASPRKPDLVIASARTRMPRPEERPVPLEIVPPAPAVPAWARKHPGERLPVWHRRDPAKETGLPANWRHGTDKNMKLDEVEQRAENAKGQFFYNWGRGMSVEEAAAWAANSEVESRSNHRTNQDGGAPGRGLFQWEEHGRAKIFEDVMGFSIDRSTLADQHVFREWELRNEFTKAKRLIDAAAGAGEKARVISLEYLKPASKEHTAKDRANLAEAIMRRIGQ